LATPWVLVTGQLVGPVDDDSGVAESEPLDMLARSLASVGSVVSSTR
jgi:hypothetical protein